MMFKTNVGPVEDDASVSYLRPETAQGIFTNFKNVVDSYYPDVPFGIAQQGKAFRNEISPRDFIFRSREFEQMEIEYFVHPDQWEPLFEEWIKRVHNWCNLLGLPESKVHELEVPAEDRAHYSKRTVDFEYDFPIGREELLGLAYRTDFDLGNIQRVSSKNMEYRPKDGGQAICAPCDRTIVWRGACGDGGAICRVLRRRTERRKAYLLGAPSAFGAGEGGSAATGKEQARACC